MNNLEEKKEGIFTKRFNISLAALSLAGVLAVGGATVHKNVDHLNSKCPFAFIYGDKIVEHQVNEIKEEHPDLLTKATYKAPVGYVLGKYGICYQETIDGKTYAYVEEIKEEPSKLSELELTEQVRKLYK